MASSRIAASNLTGAAAVPAGETDKKANVGGSFDFGFMKLMGYYDENKIPFAKEKVASISGIFPFGQSEVRIGYDISKMDQNQAGFADSNLDNIKATYQYNLSKRTAVYGTVAFLKNKDSTIVSLPGTNFVGALPNAGGDSKGFEIGHSSLLLIPRSRQRARRTDQRPPSGGLFHGCSPGGHAGNPF